MCNQYIIPNFGKNCLKDLVIASIFGNAIQCLCEKTNSIMYFNPWSHLHIQGERLLKL